MDNNMLEILLDTVPYSIWCMGLDGKFKFVNNYLAKSLNKIKEDIIGKTLFEIYGEELGKEYSDNYSKVRTLGEGILFKGYFNDNFFKMLYSANER